MNNETASLARDAQAGPATTGWARAGHAARRALARFGHWRQVRRNIALLSSLDDKMLADVGIPRDQVKHVACLGYVPGQS